VRELRMRPDVGPFFHPAIGRVPIACAPLRLGDATGCCAAVLRRTRQLAGIARANAEGVLKAGLPAT
jgi:hypothetical protein